MWGEAEWVEAAKRNSRSVQTTVGWIFWDPGAVKRYERLGLNQPLGYVAARAAPLAPAGPTSVIAAFGSISPVVINMAFDAVRSSTSFDEVWSERDQAVLEGLSRYSPGILGPLRAIGALLWPALEKLPTVGRTLFGACLDMRKAADPVLTGWHSVKCLREWRGDTHWALIAANGLSGVEASILHNAWLGYPEDWIAISRGTDPGSLDSAWASLASKGLAEGRNVTHDGIALRERIEQETDRLTTAPWMLLREDATERFAEDFEPPCELLLERVDVTAGPNYQPASRVRRSR